MEVEGCQLPKIWIRHVHIEGLRLIDKCAPICSHFHKCTLPELPYCFIELLQLVGNIEPLQMPDCTGDMISVRP